MKANTRKTIKFFFKHVRNYKKLTIIMLISIFFGVAVFRYIPFLYKKFIDIVVQEGVSDEVVGKLIGIILVIFALNIAGVVFWRICGFSNNRFQPKIMADIYRECFEKLHKHSFNFFNNNFTGALIKKINRMTRAFEGIADRVYWDFIPLIIMFVFIFSVLMYLHVYLGLSLLIWTIIFIFASYAIAKYKLKYDLKKVKADTAVTAALADTITNNSNIKFFSGLPFEQRRFKNVTENWIIKTKNAWDIDSIIEGVQALLMIILEGVIMYIAIILWQRGILSVGDFVLIQMYLIDVFRHLWELGRIIRSMYEYFADAEEMTEILQKPWEIKDKKGAEKLIVHHGKVEFKNVCFSYAKDKDVINKLSFKVKASEKIALIGPSGGGKTTIAKLLLRLFDIQNGKILIDDNNIKDVTQDSLRKNIGLVPQDPILFHRTIMENIRYGRRNASDEEVIAASKLANCHNFISNFKDGYNTYVGERGVKLSGGERQRVAIARAILNNTQVLILDEATSQLDSESEKLIQDALLNLMKNKTTFIIAHRLSTIMQADRIFVLKDGNIVEEGDHAKLVNKKGSLYKRLWDLQVGGYLKE